MSTATLAKPGGASTADVVGNDELYEVINGKRVRLPPMAILAVWTASVLQDFLGPFARTKNLGWVVTEALFHLPAPINRDRRPDVAFVSYQRWAKNRPLPRGGNAWDVVPNLAVEVVSPNDGADELREKIDEYFRAGVQLVWVVYPLASQIYVYKSPSEISVLNVGNELDGGEVVPGFRLALADLFSAAVEVAVNTNGSGV